MTTALDVIELHEIPQLARNEGETDDEYYFRLIISRHLVEPFECVPDVLPVHEIVTPIERNDRRLAAMLVRTGTGYSVPRALMFYRVWTDVLVSYNTYIQLVGSKTTPATITRESMRIMREADIYQALYPTWGGHRPTSLRLTEDNKHDYVQHAIDVRTGMLRAIGLDPPLPVPEEPVDTDSANLLADPENVEA